MVKALMIQGTGSGAGKSLIVAALCRIFHHDGIDVAPFKAQNMALNSFITSDGGEIGRAQALQATAAGIESTVDMNPVLLKVSGEHGSQVILRGRVHATMKAREYYAFRNEAWKFVTDSYKRLSAKHDLIVIEGAGSPAEINLSDVDIVNMTMAKHAKAPVILVGDIDKGGVFASLFGTVKLLGRDGRHIKGFLINKFRGDAAILEPGLDMIRERTGKPVIGVLPYIREIGLPEEDGLALSRRKNGNGRPADPSSIKTVIVRLQYISNFTDFDPLEMEPGMDVVYSDDPSDLEDADIVIIPGSKNTVEDLLLLKKKHLDESIRKVFARGAQVIGICGGYQMLGKRISDPHATESGYGSVEGVGLLNIETLFRKEKQTCRVEAEINAECGVRNAEWKSGETLKGYEIHMGESTGDIGLFRITRVTANPELSAPDHSVVLDGSRNANCWGTYIHGIFENDGFRRGVINSARARKGLEPLNGEVRFGSRQEEALDNLAGIVRKHVDMDFIRRLIA